MTFKSGELPFKSGERLVIMGDSVGNHYGHHSLPVGTTVVVEEIYAQENHSRVRVQSVPDGHLLEDYNHSHWFVIDSDLLPVDQVFHPGQDVEAFLNAR